MPIQAMAPVTGDDEFQKELLELFAQEAQAWLDQADAALSELESRPPADRHAKLVEVIARGLTNLGGSAATVNLPAIERSASARFIAEGVDRSCATPGRTRRATN